MLCPFVCIYIIVKDNGTVEKAGRKMSKFLRGTFILLIATFVTRILGFINRIVIARSIGEEGVGLYMMAYPTFILAVTLTQMGLPVAISKSVAEAEARGDFRRIKKILVVSLGVTISLSLVFTPGLLLCAPFISKTLFTDERTFYPLLAIAPVIPVVAVSSVLRGYFQGRQNMKPSAISQVLEQAIRIALIAVMTKTFLPYGVEFTAAGAMIASVLGELGSLLYLFTTFKMKKRFRVRNHFLKTIFSGGDVFKELMVVGIPTMGSRLIGSLSWFLEPIVVSRSLAIAGIASGVATQQYGMLTGFALPLLLLPSFITTSLSTSLVPAISEANAHKNYRLLEYQVQEALRFCLVTGGLAVIILYLYAEPMMQLMYGSNKGAVFIQLMAPFFLFQYYQGPLQAVLQALNLADAAMINSFIGSFVKLAVIFVLASQPSFGIYGAALGIVTGTMLVTLLHLMTAVKKLSLTIYVRDYLHFIFVVVVVIIFSKLADQYVLTTESPFIRFLAGATFTSVLYIIISGAAGLIKKRDLLKIPIVKKWI